MVIIKTDFSLMGYDNEIPFTRRVHNLSSYADHKLMPQEKKTRALPLPLLQSLTKTPQTFSFLFLFCTHSYLHPQFSAKPLFREQKKTTHSPLFFFFFTREVQRLFFLKPLNGQPFYAFFSLFFLNRMAQPSALHFDAFL